MQGEGPPLSTRAVELRGQRWHLTRVRTGGDHHRKRGTVAVFAASALHAAVLLALLVTPVRRRTPQVTSPVAPVDVSMAIDIDAPADDAVPPPAEEVASTATETGPIATA